MPVTDENVMFVGPNILLKVSKEVYECWLLHRQMKSRDTEQFGVLIGSRVENESLIWVDTCTTPQKKDISQRAKFVMKDPYHQKKIDEAYEDSNGELGYIGTWHTHPQNNPIPSIIDLNDWNQCAFRNADRQLIFIIVGNKSINIYININNNFEVLTRKIDE